MKYSEYRDLYEDVALTLTERRKHGIQNSKDIGRVKNPTVARATGDLAVPNQLSLVGTEPPSKAVSETARKCLRRQPAREWTHQGQNRDNRTVAVWCGCAECYQMLTGSMIVYRRRPKS